jgi:uncharacterized protein (DUF302 family)
MEKKTPYCFGKTLDMPYQEAVAKVRAALAEQGFGILTEIDVRDKLKEKLDIDFRPYIILGACNPRMAHRALSVEINLGTLLPCNVVVYTDAEGRTTVMAMDPAGVLDVVANPAMNVIAQEVRSQLVAALESL